MSAASEIGKFITEWIRTIQATQKAIETKDLSIVRHQVILQGAREGNNFVNREGYNHLQQAACIILRDEKLGQKLSLNTGVNAVVQAHFELLPKAKTKKQFSEQGIANRARELLLAAPRQSGTYVYPLVFAPAATATDWGFGPVRIVSKTIFLGQYKAVFDAERNAEGETIRAKLLEDWEAHAKIYDHYILIEMPDY